METFCCISLLPPQVSCKTYLMAKQAGYPGSSPFQGITPSFCQDLSLLTYGAARELQLCSGLLLASTTTKAKMLQESRALTPRQSKTHSAQHCPKCRRGHPHCTCRHSGLLPHFVPGLSHLTVQTQHHQHGEEED